MEILFQMAERQAENCSDGGLLRPAAAGVKDRLLFQRLAHWAE